MKQKIALVSLLCTLQLSAQDSFVNSIGMKFVKIPAGSFMMGSDHKPCPKDDPFTYEDESNCMSRQDKNAAPRHKVNLKSFYTGTTEVTQEQWYKITGTNPSEIKGRTLPVFNFNRKETDMFVNKLNKLDKGVHYSVMTEAQWEYIVTSDPAYHIFDNPYGKGVKNKIYQMAWLKGNSNDTLHPVAQKKPDSFGIYDLIGNAHERLLDRAHHPYGGGYIGVPSDGSAWITRGRKYEMYRGGNYYDTYDHFTSMWMRYKSSGMDTIRLVYNGSSNPMKKDTNNNFTNTALHKESRKGTHINTNAQDTNYFNSLSNDSKPVNIE